MKNDNWYQLKEQAAGKKRLILTYKLYKIFGAKILYFISFLVSLSVFLFSKKIRNYSKEALKVINKNFGLISQFKHILSYSNSLADKIILYSGDYDFNNVIFENDEKKEELFNDIKKEKGVFLICSHIGNIEIMQALFSNPNYSINKKVNIFLSNKQGQIFNSFLDEIKVKLPIKIYSPDEIDIDTGIDLKEKLDNGEILFMAGDRISENGGEKIETDFLNKKIYLPKGTFKLTKFMKTPVYFVSAIKINKVYKIFLEKQNNLEFEKLIENYSKFLENITAVNPYQFFNFYEVFH